VPRLLPAGGVPYVVVVLVLFALVMVTAGFGVREYAVYRLSAI
jgi:biopolymer transport protein ExbD